MKQLTMIAAIVLAACASAPPAWEDAAELSTFCVRGYAGGIEGEWELARINGVEWDGTTVTLRAADGELGGQMACNGYGAGGVAPDDDAYAVEDTRLILPNGVLQTVMACRDRERMDFDAAFTAILHDRPYVVRGADQLCLRTEDNRSLEFWRAESAEASDDIATAPLDED